MFKKLVSNYFNSIKDKKFFYSAIILFGIFCSSLGINNFRFDASSETLILDNDVDYQIYEQTMMISVHPGLESEEEKIPRMAADAEWAAKILAGKWDSFLEAWEAQPVLQGQCETPLADRSILRERQVAVARGFTSWSLGKQENLRSLLASITRPVFWLSGSRDPKFVSLTDSVWKEMPDGYLLGPVKAGHRVPWEAPEEFLQCVEHLLDVVNR